jgi:hypothetical protein
MKSLFLCLCMLISLVGCGAYGSGGMNLTPAPAPMFEPVAGTYSVAELTITIGDTQQGATIYFTTDGTAPSLNSPVYTGPFTIRTSTIVQAIAVANGFSTSNVTTAGYTLQ